MLPTNLVNSWRPVTHDDRDPILPSQFGEVKGTDLGQHLESALTILGKPGAWAVHFFPALLITLPAARRPFWTQRSQTGLK